MITKPKELPNCPSQIRLYLCVYAFNSEQRVSSLSVTGSNQAYRAISTSQLNVLPRLHLWPIDEVVYLGSQGYLVLRGASRLDAFSGYPVRS
jgi:hypothetical protein